MFLIKQPKLRTVEGEIIKALTNSKIITDEKNAELKVASRTDKVVSAVGNVVTLNTDFRKEEILFTTCSLGHRPAVCVF